MRLRVCRLEAAGADEAGVALPPLRDGLCRPWHQAQGYPTGRRFWGEQMKQHAHEHAHEGGGCCGCVSDREYPVEHSLLRGECARAGVFEGSVGGVCQGRRWQTLAQDCGRGRESCPGHLKGAEERDGGQLCWHRWGCSTSMHGSGVEKVMKPVMRPCLT